MESGEGGVESEPTDPPRSGLPIPGSPLSTPHSPLSTPTDEDEFPPVLNDELAKEGSDWPEDGPADLSVALPKSTSLLVRLDVLRR